MSKGSSSPSGYTNVTNPAQVSQQPYLNYGYEQAKDLYQNNPQNYYSGQTLAQHESEQRGYQNMINTSQRMGEWSQPAANVYNQAASGQMGNAGNPASPYYTGYAQGTSPISQNFQGLQQSAQQGGAGYAGAVGQYANPMAGLGYQAINSNLGLSQLGKTASGEYLNNSNPYMAQMVQSAMDPVTRNYQTSIAPGLDAAAAVSGRYGSGAQANQASTAQQNLTKGLSDLSGNLYGQQYARERQAQDAAAQNYGQLINSGIGLGMQGLQNAANIQNAAGGQYWQGQNAAQLAAQQQAAANQYGISGLNTGFNQGNQNALEALRQYPQLANAQFLGAQKEAEGGKGMAAYGQARLSDELARYQGNQMAPYNTLNAYMQSIGSPQQGSSSTPYYRNQGAETMSGITGALGIGKSLLGGLSKI